MKAFSITEPGQWRFVERDPVRPAGGDVLLKIEVVGYCGTDFSTFVGKNPLVSYPRVPGHEIAATVVEAGPDVPPHIKPGQRTTLSPYSNCGRCTACRNKRPNACANNQTLGVQRDGALTEYIAAPWERLYPVPALSFKELALVEPLSIGFHAVARGRVTEAETVAVLGCGAIGLSVVAGAGARKARIIAVDIDEKKLETARACGAGVTVGAASGDVAGQLRACTGGHGPDVVIEAVGVPATFQLAVEAVSPTGRVVYLGYAKEPVSYTTSQFILKELDILGSRNALHEDFEAVIDFLHKKTFPVAQVVSTTVPFEEAGHAFAEWAHDPSRFTKIHVAVR